MATIRSSSPEAETRIPVRIGRVSSLDAERATWPTVSTNAAAGIWTTESPPGAGSGGKSSARSVRRWKRAVAEMISTSPSEGRSSSETSEPGSCRATSSSRRAGRTTSPGRATSARSGTRRPISMSVARSSTPSSPAATWTPESAWTALRVEATRETVCSWPSSSCVVVDNFTMDT